VVEPVSAITNFLHFGTLWECCVAAGTPSEEKEGRGRKGGGKGGWSTRAFYALSELPKSVLSRTLRCFLVWEVNFQLGGGREEERDSI